MTTPARAQHDDSGFSMVELVIAMFVFAIIAMAILPAAVQATKLSAVNREHVSANAFASAELAGIRAAFPDDATNSCAAVRAYQTSTNIADPAASGLTASRTVASCPSTYPGLVTVTARVFDPKTSTSRPAVVISTRIVVTGS